MWMMPTARRHLRTSPRLQFVALFLHGGATLAQCDDAILSPGLDRFSLRIVVYDPDGGTALGAGVNSSKAFLRLRF